MSIVFKDAFYYFDENQYYDKVLNKSGISKKIDTELITHFFRDILKQYNNLYSISSAIEKHLTSKRNKKIFTSYTKSLLIIEENFKFIDTQNMFENTFEKEVLIGNKNNLNNLKNNRKSIRSIYDYFNNIKDFIDKIHKHEIEHRFNEYQTQLIIYYILFEKHFNDKIKSKQSLENQLPNVKSIMKSFINDFSEYFERASKDYKACQLYFKDMNNSNKKFVKENILFILILNYENIYKCLECIHDLIDQLTKTFKFQKIAIKNIMNKISKNGNKKNLETNIVKLLKEIA